MCQKFDRWAKKQILLGNPLFEIFQKELAKLTESELLQLKLKMES